MTGPLSLLAGTLLSYSNGANDNYKGVATLFGSGTTGYRRALLWATGTTLAGSIAAVWLAGELLGRFSGKGLVPDELAAGTDFLLAVGLAAGATVMLATRLGLPVSTTHALVGGLLGAGVAHSASSVAWSRLAANFVAPLCFSPLVALAATAALYSVLRLGRVALGVTKETCFCVGSEAVEVVPVISHRVALKRAEQLTASFGSTVTCQERYNGCFLGVQVGRVLDGWHFLSAGLVSFARGLNDTPKIAALFLAAPLLGSTATIVLCGAVMAIGGLASARRVATTVSRRITSMNAGQGLTANLVTGLLVVVASRWGLPVSTTHVSCGSLFGIGAVTGRGRWNWIVRILLAWVVTLPLAAAVSFAALQILQRLS